VIIPGDEPRTIDSKLIDISGTGLRFLSPEPVDSEMVVAVEVDSRLVLCEIRYCQDRGDRYVVGARRLHEIAKDAQLADAPAVVTEMLGHLRRHIAGAGAGDSQKMAVRQLEQIVERGGESPDSFPMPEPVRDAPPLPAPDPIPPEPEIPPIEAIQEPPAEEPVEEIEELAQESVQDHAPGHDGGGVPSPGEDEAPEKTVQQHAPGAPPPQAAPVDPLEAARQALLGSESILAAPSGERKTGSRVLFAVAAGLILAALLGFYRFQHRSEARPAQSAAVAVRPRPADPPPAPATAHHARIHVLRPTWISLSVDGSAAVQPALKQDDVRDFEFSKHAILRVADGSAIEISIDANSVGPLASGQQVLNLQPNGVEVVK